MRAEEGFRAGETAARETVPDDAPRQGDLAVRRKPMAPAPALAHVAGRTGWDPLLRERAEGLGRARVSALADRFPNARFPFIDMGKRAAPGKRDTDRDGVTLRLQTRLSRFHHAAWALIISRPTDN